MSLQPLSLDEIRAAADGLAGQINVTPVVPWHGNELQRLLGAGTEVSVKLEQLQRSGTFKARGALTAMLSAGEEALRAGVTAFSAGNHAVATAYAAACLGTQAHVVMQQSANWLRVAKARAYGAKIEMAVDGAAARRRAEELVAQDGRFFVHPFENRDTVRGTATLGLEWIEQTAPLDAVIVSVGGGGLISGVASAFRLLSPNTQIIGVEPEGADVMQRSLAAGTPQNMPTVTTIADSLGPPAAEPLTFEFCREYVHEFVRVSDAQIRDAMALIFYDLNQAVEPAGAAATAALIGPLRERLRGQRIGVLICGSIIDADSFSKHIRDSGKTIPFDG
ncbi:MAG: threonine/serine dehydratase [Chromatiales bacterium]|nr:MAG: threonine/serine dehydratase [Chromatiales bacterium]